MVIGSFEGPSRAGGHLEMTTSGRGVGDNRGGVLRLQRRKGGGGVMGKCDRKITH